MLVSETSKRRPVASVFLFQQHHQGEILIGVFLEPSEYFTRIYLLMIFLISIARLNPTTYTRSNF